MGADLAGRAGEPGVGATPFTAIALVLLANGLFALLDCSAKYVGQTLPVLEIAWFRYALHFLLAAVIFNPRTSPGAWRVQHVWLQILRALMLAGMTLANFTALRYLQLAQTVSISFLAPLLVAGLSALLFGETIGGRRLAAILFGFCGVLVITRPGLQGFHPAMLFALLSVSFNAVYSLLTRHLAVRETVGSMTLVLAGLPTILLAPALPAVWHTPTDLLQWSLLLLIGALGGGGHLMIMLAHRHASAARLAPFSYSQIVWMTSLGYLIFNDLPDGWTFVGGAVVVASGLYLLHRERVVSRQRLTASRP